MPLAPAHIRVLVRIRPLNSSEIIGGYGRSNVLTVENAGSEPIDFNSSDDGANISGATITVSTDDVQGRRRNLSLESYRNSTGYASDNDSVAGNGSLSNGKQFTFDAVHGARSTQCEVFNSVKGIVDAVASGYNGTIFAYGQTGSGKTHTVFGNSESESEFGLVQRSLRALFNKIALTQAQVATGNFSEINEESDGRSTTTTTYKASFFEIFNEKVYDLLSTDSLEKDLKVRENVNSVYVEGLKEITVENTVEAEEILYRGMANRHVSATNMNRTSSRSHAIFVLTVKNVRVSVDGLKKVRTSKFTLVDLAGSERQKSTDAWGARLTEASSINKSLTCLGTVINALVDREAGKERHIPVRDSKLTFLLRDSWGGNSKTCLVATVSPSPNSLSETMSTLNFAQRAKLVKNNAVLNEDTCGDVAAMKAEISMLRSQLEDAGCHKEVDRDKCINSPDEMHKDGDIMRVINCRARRNEEKVKRLEKDLNDENKKVNVLKRKIMQESLVRKIKDRRIQYLERRNRNVPKNEEISTLQEELETIKQLVDLPSVEAIEWRAEYSKLKEHMQYVVNEKYEEKASDEYDRKRLEGMVEKLHKEKKMQEKKLTEMVRSNTETQNEIDSILLEVEKQEKEMVHLKEVLRDTEQKLSLSDCKIAEIEADKQKVRCEMVSLEIEKERTESELEDLKITSYEYTKEIERMRGEIKKKNSELAQLQLTNEELMNDLESKIDELTNRFQEDAKNLQLSEADLKKRFSLALKENSILKQDLNEMKSNSEEQRHLIDSLEKTVKTLEIEKQTKLDEKHAFEERLKKSVFEAEEQCRRLTTENMSLQSNMIEKNQKIIDLEGELNQQSKSVMEMDARLTNVDSEKKELIESLKEHIKFIDEEKLVLLKNVEKLEREHNHISSKNVELQQKVDLAEKKEQELRDLNEQKALDFNQLKKSIIEDGKNFQICKQALEGELLEIKAEKKELECLLKDTKFDLQNISCLMKEQNESIVDLKHQIKLLNEEKDLTLKSTNQSKEETRNSYESKIRNLEIDKEKLYKELSEAQQKLSGDEKKMSSLETTSNDYEIKLMKTEKQLQELQHIHSCQNDENTSTVRSLEEKIYHLNKEISMLNSKIDSEKETANKNDVTIKQYKSEIILMEDKIKSLQETYKNSLQKIQNEKLQLDDSFVMKERRLRSSLKEAVLDQENLQIKLNDLEDEKTHLLKQISTLEKTAEDSKETVSSTFEEFRRKESALLSLERKYETEMLEKTQLVDQLNKEIVSLKSDKNNIAVEIGDLKKSSQEYKKKMNSYKDQLTLMKRERGSLKFELETLRQSHDNTLSEEKIMRELNDELRMENETLKKQINEYIQSRSSLHQKIENSYGISPKQRMKGIKSVLTPIRRNTTNPPNLLHQSKIVDQFSTLDSQMDNVLNNISHSPPKTASTCDDNDESFDESLFLPNAGEDPIIDKENVIHSDKKVIQISEEKIHKSLVASSPSKKRGVLSAIKSSAKKRKKRKKQKDNSTSYRNNWMLFDNAKIFSDKK